MPLVFAMNFFSAERHMQYLSPLTTLNIAIDCISQQNLLSWFINNRPLDNVVVDAKLMLTKQQTNGQMNI